MEPTEQPRSPEQLNALKELWIECQIDILHHNFRNGIPVHSMSLCCDPLQRLQIDNGPLKYNYAE